VWRPVEAALVGWCVCHDDGTVSGQSCVHCFGSAVHGLLSHACKADLTVTGAFSITHQECSEYRASQHALLPELCKLQMLFLALLACSIHMYTTHFKTLMCPPLIRMNHLVRLTSSCATPDFGTFPSALPLLGPCPLPQKRFANCSWVASGQNHSYFVRSSATY